MRSAARAGKRLANTKRDERERRQQGIRFRRAGVIGAGLIGAVLVVWALAELYRAPILPVAKVEVKGTRHLTREAVLDRARVPADATLLRLPGRAIETRVEGDPWVVSARVSRRFPSTLVIEIDERAPAAIVDAGGSKLWVVSGDGVWLSERSSEDTGLPVIRDVDRLTPAQGKPVGRAQVANALKIVAGISEDLRSQVRVVSAPTVEKTALVTESDVEIFFGRAERITDKDAVAREILRKEKGKVVYINVRVVDDPAWRGL